jgi:flagellar motility protein MotE (MotC chaperone)
MTKSQRCASFPRPAKLCRILLLLALVKLCLMGSLLLDPIANFFNPVFHFLDDAPETAAVAEAPAPLFGPGAALAAPAGVPPAPVAATDAGQSPNLAREALARKEQELARKEQDLLTLQRELDDRLEQLQVLENRLSVMLQDANEVKDEKFRKLVDMLSNMKARQAASVLETLEESTAVKVLAGMRGRQSGEILTYVNPVKAARLSEVLTRMQLPFE